MRVPSGEKMAEVKTMERTGERTAAVCFRRVSVSRPVCASQTLAVLSALPVTMRVPSGEKATE